MTNFQSKRGQHMHPITDFQKHGINFIHVKDISVLLFVWNEIDMHLSLTEFSSAVS